MQIVMGGEVGGWVGRQVEVEGQVGRRVSRRESEQMNNWAGIGRQAAKQVCKKLRRREIC